MSTRTLWTSVVALLAMAPCVWAGPLDPPAGPIASTPGPEPRIPVSAATTPGDVNSQFIISQPGSYYLTGNITGVSGRSAVRIAVSGVDLDLNGFTLTGVGGSVHGVQLGSVARVRIHNGVITAFGTHGVAAVNTDSVVAEDLIVEFCGGNGLDMGNTSRIERCTIRSNALLGIRLGASSSAVGCLAIANSTGIEANANCRVIGCSVNGNVQRGVLAAGANTVIENNAVTSSTPSALGVQVNGSRCLIRNNSIAGNNSSGQGGLSVGGTNNVISDNIVRDHPDNYSIVGQPNQVSLIIAQVPETLDFPCSAVLAGNMATPTGNGITIAADGVSLDLGGNELTAGASGTGILSTGSRRNVVVRNGSVRGFSAGGVNLTSCVSPQVVGIRAMANTGGGGISVNGGQVLECEAVGNTGVGISAGDNALVSRCSSTGNSLDNIAVNQGSTVDGCVASGSTAGNGIACSFIHCTVSNCTASGNALSGIRLAQRSRVVDCAVYNSVLHGVHMSFLGVVERCTIGGCLGNGILMDAGGGAIVRDNVVFECSTTNTAGIKFTVGLGRVEGNHVLGCWRSFDVSGGGTMLARNTSAAAGAGGHYVITPGNPFGPIVNVAGVGDISATPNANHPQANFQY
jgi:hypothetical protein